MNGCALEGIKVVEYATMVSGPYCGKLLGDMGAEVIKVEPPGGDPARGCGPFLNGVKHPELSPLFLYNNTSKKGVTMDLETTEGARAFTRLLQWADVLIENHPPGYCEKLGFGWGDVHRLNPGLMYVSITPYGSTGPRSGAKADELTITHAGGVGFVLPARSTNIERAPVKMGGYQAGYNGGLAAAVAVLALLMGRGKTGEGRLIDISLQDVLLGLVGPYVIHARYHQSTWHRVPDRPPGTGRMETSDGYVVPGAADDHHFRAFREIMGKPSWAASDEWDDMEWRTNHLMDIAPNIEAWMKQQKKMDVYHRMAKAGIPVGPINTAAEVMNSAQYISRSYFTPVEHPRAGRHLYAGWAYKMTASPPAISRPAPLLGQHNEEVFRTLLAGPSVKGDSSSASQNKGLGGAKETRQRLPLQGMRILDFCWVVAGPYACMLLANLGAEVIRVESHRRTDLMRRTFAWPLHEPSPIRVPPNQGMLYNFANRNKRSVTLDLSKPEGLELARRLVAISDAVVDNMRPDAMIKMGLGYDELRRIRPDLVVAASSSRGHEGPEKAYLGFATIHQSIGGLAYLTGYFDGPPSVGTPADADVMNATGTAFAVLAALFHRARTGEGQFIDYSQCEGCSSLIGEQLLAYAISGRIPERMGNAHPEHAPHGVYRCWGVDRWLALEVHTDEEFGQLALLMGRPELARDPRFADNAARKRHEAELNTLIEDWTCRRDRDWIAEELCRTGIAAAPSRDMKDLYSDRHLRARDAFAKVDHPELGELELTGCPWKISDLDEPAQAAPLLGEHNQYVLGDLLGLADDEITALRSKGIIL